MEFFSPLFLLFSVNGINYAASLFSCEEKALVASVFSATFAKRIIMLYVPSCHRAIVPSVWLLVLTGEHFSHFPFLRSLTSLSNHGPPLSTEEEDGDYC